MSARFLIGSLIATSIWYGLYWRVYELSFGKIALRVVGFSFCGALLGKIVGIIAARTVQLGSSAPGSR